ncbi:MAG: class I SAM-dependent methyltransferase [Cyclobacteriaceae bacterium]|nr:class I SAM-dependent methyltransferase [Cyclobacteriaceae bacterium]
MKEFWNERFGQSEYSYGKAPNFFFTEQLNRLLKGKLLLPAEGEGRNAVYAAVKGWKVTAFDYSEEGQKKALDLAKEYEVEIDYQVQSANKFNTSEKYDAIALIFAHFAGEERQKLFHKLDSCLIADGNLILEVFSKNQLGRESGGPKNLDLLYSKDEIKALFPNIDFIILEETKVMLNEGSSHQGEAAVIRALGVKQD